ncbi:MAG: hypothetical protein WA728_13125 [Xanthobacteraceae bacterium]
MNDSRREAEEDIYDRPVPGCCHLPDFYGPHVHVSTLGFVTGMMQQHRICIARMHSMVRRRLPPHRSSLLAQNNSRFERRLLNLPELIKSEAAALLRMAVGVIGGQASRDEARPIAANVAKLRGLCVRKANEALIALRSSGCRACRFDRAEPKALAAR